MSLKRGYKLTSFGECNKAKKNRYRERLRERLSVEEFDDYLLLVRRPACSLSIMEFQRVLDYMVKAGIIEEVFF